MTMFTPANLTPFRGTLQTPRQTPSPVLFGAKKKAAPDKQPPGATPPQTAAPVETERLSPGVRPPAKAPKKDWAAYYAQLEAATSPNPTPFDRLLVAGTEVIVYDLETTGLTPRGEKPTDPPPPGGFDDLVEVSAIKYKDGQIQDRFYALVNPRKPIPQEVVELTGITNEKVQAEGAPTEVAMTRFFEFIGEKPILIGHNAKWFDTKFMRALCDRYNFPEMKDRLNYDHIVDTKIIAQKLFPDSVWKYDENGKGIAPTPGPDSPANLKLTTLAAFLGFENEGAHRAENDVEMCAKIFYKMLEKIEDKGTSIQTFGDVYQYQFTPYKRRGKKKPPATPPAAGESQPPAQG